MVALRGLVAQRLDPPGSAEQLLSPKVNARTARRQHPGGEVGRHRSLFAGSTRAGGLRSTPSRRPRGAVAVRGG
jgi:hypothetical protein